MFHTVETLCFIVQNILFQALEQFVSNRQTVCFKAWNTLFVQDELFILYVVTTRLSGDSFFIISSILFGVIGDRWGDRLIYNLSPSETTMNKWI